MRIHGLQLVFVLAVLGCNSAPEFDPTTDRFTGAEAKARVERWADEGGKLPGSATNFYIFDGGSFNGSIIYASFDCGNREDCWVALKLLGSPDSTEFKPWAASRYSVVMQGPGFYHQILKDDPWDVRGIEEGVVYEQTDADHRRMIYYAIDFAKDRVYIHEESGGFPPDIYEP